MAKLDQDRFASMVRMLQIAHPRRWDSHLRNLGVTSLDVAPADLDRIMERVFWIVRQAGIKHPADWIKNDMARVAAASVAVEPEGPLKVALPVKLEPVKLGVDPTTTSDTSPVASKTGIVVRVAAPLTSVEPEAPLKVAPPVAVRQEELDPVKLGVDPAKTSGASPLA
jgi:hypothetical protein